MYKNLKYMMYASLVMFGTLLLMAFALNGASKNKPKNNIHEYNKEEATQQKTVTQTNQERFESTTVKVSPETRDYMYPSEDPLNSVSSNNPNYITPEIPNLPSPRNKQGSNVNVTEFDPFNTTANDTDNNVTQQLTPKTNIVLYKQDNQIALGYDIMSDFRINNTQFYVIGQVLTNQQRYANFTVRKYYIYKRQGQNLVQCFDLFQRQDRTGTELSSLITVNTMAEDTEITYNGANSVTRVIDNNQLLAPYGDKKDRILLIKSE